MEQLAIVATLRDDAEEEARRLIDLGPPFDLAERGFTRHSVFMSQDEIVFVFEARDVEGILNAMVTDEGAWVLQSTFEAWRPLLEGEPRVAPLVFSWKREAQPAEQPSEAES
jgi:hypothetical protein